MQTVRVERLGLAGDGLAGDLRVPLALPGEVARGPVEGRILAPAEILEASPDRATPPCPHFGVCGGCALQHASDSFVAGWKRDTVARALAARGVAAEVGAARTSPPRSRRRAVFAARRTKKGALVGFHGRRSDEIVETPGCLLVSPELLAARPALATLAARGASRSGVLRMGVTLSEGGLDVDVAGGKTLDADLRRGLVEAAEAADLARLAWDGEPLAMRRPPAQRLGPARVVPPPGAFLQATAEGAAALTSAVAAAVAGAARVVDLFAGCGTFTLPLAETAEVRAVEAEAEMLAALAAGWRAAPGLRRVTTEARDLFRRPLSPADLAAFDAAVMDPPRAGAEAQTAALAASRLGLVAMVSCNPVTFARDAAALVAAGFRLGPVEVVDQFRWSGHVEIAARFDR